MPHEHNRNAWDRLANSRHNFSRPATDEEFHNPLVALDGLGWLGTSVAGQRILCLAAGGGRQGPLYAAAGAEVTVVDLSQRQLDLDRQIAAERGLSLSVRQGSMDQLDLADAAFDIVIHPVSTCYLPRIARTYAEVHRVLAANGLYVSQHKSPTSLQTSHTLTEGGYVLQTAYYHQGPLPACPPNRFREHGTLEYLHRWESLLGQLCRSGFVIEDVVEPFHGEAGASAGSFAHRCHFVPPYVRLKARRIPRREEVTSSPAVWIPD